MAHSAHNTDHPPYDILYIGFVLGHGGDAVQMLELASGMARRGARVKVVVPAVETTLEFAERCRQRGVDVERSPLLRIKEYGTRQNPFRLFRFFSGCNASVVHFHSGDVCLPRLALMVMNLRRFPRAFITIQSPYSTITPGGLRARQWAAGAPARFYRIICPSEHSLQTQISYGIPPELLQVIPNSVDTRAYTSGDPSRARAALGLPEQSQLVVFTSRIEQQKRPLDAIRAFALIAADLPETHLVFVGRGALEQKAKAEAVRAGLTGRIHFVGHQSNVPDWLAAASVWVLPTESENFSLAVLEALAAGCPIVSTLCQGNDEVLVDGENALIAGIGNKQEMASEMRRLLTDRDLANRLSTHAQRTAEAYSIDRIVEQYACCYAEHVPAMRALATPSFQHQSLSG